jgi:hypothetical protein
MLKASKGYDFESIGGHSVVGQVYETKDYQVFKLRRDNRDIKDNLNLKEELKAHGIIQPILVNEKYEVIDGQNRLDIAIKLGLPVPYIVKPGAGKTEIKSVNTTSNRWDINDYINTYAKDGVEEYEKMKRLLASYNITPGVMCSLAFNTTDSQRPYNKVRDGRLQFYNYDFLVDYLEFYKDLIENTTLKNLGGLAKSLYILFRLKKFNPERIFDKSGRIAKSLQGVTEQGTITIELLRIYNERLRDPAAVINYRDTRSGVEFIGEELKESLIGK